MDNLNCEWHIRMPLKQKLKLAFVKKFGIEHTTNCSTDYLEVCVIYYYKLNKNNNSIHQIFIFLNYF